MSSEIDGTLTEYEYFNGRLVDYIYTFYNLHQKRS